MSKPRLPEDWSQFVQRCVGEFNPAAFRGGDRPSRHPQLEFAVYMYEQIDMGAHNLTRKEARRQRDRLAHRVAFLVAQKLQED